MGSFGFRDEVVSLLLGIGSKIDRDRGKDLGSGVICFACVGYRGVSFCNFFRMSRGFGVGLELFSFESLFLFII